MLSGGAVVAGSAWVCVRGGVGRLLVAVVGAVGLSVFAFSPAAAAACQTGAVTFTSTGAEQCYTVALGVDELGIVAVGGKGGAGSDVGGFGAVVSGEIGVSGGETLEVEVGGDGSTGG